MMDQRAIEELCLRYLDENLTEQEARVLDRLIATSDAAARTLARLAIHDRHFEVTTPLHSAKNDQDSDTERALDERLWHELQGSMNFAVWRQERTNKAAAERRKTWLIRSLISGAVAAVLLVAVSLITTVFTSGSPEAPVAGQQANEQHTTAPPDHPPIDSARASVATLTATHNATWAEGAFAPGSELAPNQRLTLIHGFAQITTARGDIAIVEAPATIELLDHDNALRLHTGKLVGICETDASKGFLVRTRHMDVTDLGTHFGVATIDPIGTLAEVFDGRVHAVHTASNQDQTGAIELARGESFAVDHDGQVVGRDTFADELFASLRNVGTGVVAMTGSIEQSPYTIANRDQGGPPPLHQVVLSQELRQHALTAAVPLTFAETGTYRDFAQTRSSAPAGTVIRTYILFHTGNRSETLTRGSVTFEGEILGATANEQDWQGFVEVTASAGQRVLPAGRYSSLESWGPGGGAIPNEQFVISEDRRTLDFQFRTAGEDALRIIVREPRVAQP